MQFHLQDGCFQVRIECCPLIIRLIDSLVSAARPTVPLSLSFHLLCPSFFLITPGSVYTISSLCRSEQVRCARC
jgi:hypothetical protein